MHYPIIDRIIFSIGPLDIRWYGLSYLAAFASAWLLARWRAKRPQLQQPGDRWSDEDISDLIFYGAVGGVIGGRLGYLLVYSFDQLVRDPLFLLRIWEGGMSIHGGFAGAVVALWLFARRTKRGFWQVADFTAPLVPLGLGLGRLGNFANTELPGRATDSALGFIYPCASDAIRAINPLCTGQWESFARHPSPLYQAFGEGIVLFCIVWFVARKARPVGVVSGVFIMGYGLVRLVTENFRHPDSHIGFLAFDWLTMGQTLSIPMVIVGILLILMGGNNRLGNAKPGTKAATPTKTQA